LKDRRFHRLFLGRTLGMLGGSYAPVALAFGVLGLPNAHPSTLSVVLAAESIPMVLFMLVGGVLADRFPRDRVIVAGNLLCATGFLTTAALLISGWAPVWALAAAAAVGGTGVAVFFPAVMGIVPQVVAAERLQTANSVLGFGMNAARLLGAAIAGVTVALVGGGWALMGSALLFVASATLIMGLRLPRIAPGEAGPSMLHELRVGWRNSPAGSGSGWWWRSSRSWSWVCRRRSACSDRGWPNTSWAGLRPGLPSWQPSQPG
jgi:MFS family permease